MVGEPLYPTESSGAMERSIGVFAMGVAHCAVSAAAEPKSTGLKTRHYMAQWGAWQAFYAARCGFSLPGSAAAPADCGLAGEASSLLLWRRAAIRLANTASLAASGSSAARCRAMAVWLVRMSCEM